MVSCLSAMIHAHVTHDRYSVAKHLMHQCTTMCMHICTDIYLEIYTAYCNQCIALRHPNPFLEVKHQLHLHCTIRGEIETRWMIGDSEFPERSTRQTVDVRIDADDSSRGSGPEIQEREQQRPTRRYRA